MLCLALIAFGVFRARNIMCIYILFRHVFVIVVFADCQSLIRLFLQSG